VALRMRPAREADVEAIANLHVRSWRYGHQGLASSGPTRDPFVEAGVAEIYEVFVKPEVVGTGVGTALFRETLKRLSEAGFDATTLWVLEGNDSARRFYGRQGLHEDGATKITKMGDAEAVEVRYRASLD
jgi:ribosomal protein S18 acetylase RimI-like enzyme